MVVDEQVEERETADNVATFFVYPRSRQSTLPERPSRADEARRAGGRYTTWLTRRYRYRLLYDLLVERKES